jgi:hypothetical protein
VLALRRPARRRGDARIVTLGYLFVGGSSFVLLAAGPRMLGRETFSGLGLIWTVSTLFGIGIATPTEQVINRRMNGGTRGAVVGPLRVLLALAVAAATACLLIGPHAAAAQRLELLGPGMALTVAGWTAAVAVRGRLAGTGDLVGYTAVLMAEGLIRVGMVALAILLPGEAMVLLATAAGLPLLLAGLVGLAVRVPVGEGPPGEGPADVAALSGPDVEQPSAPAEQAMFVLVSMGFQICLNGAPVLLEWRFGSLLPAAVGAFVAASTYFRTPALLAGGVLTHALVELSHAWGAADPVRFRAARSAGLRRTLLVIVPSTAAVALVAPFALRLYYGAPVDLPWLVLAALPVSTVLAVVAAGLWLGGAAVTSLLLATSDGLDWRFALGLLAGPGMALAGALLADRRLVNPAPQIQPAG